MKNWRCSLPWRVVSKSKKIKDKKLLEEREKQIRATSHSSESNFALEQPWFYCSKQFRGEKYLPLDFESRGRKMLQFWSEVVESCIKGGTEKVWSHEVAVGISCKAYYFGGNLFCNAHRLRIWSWHILLGVDLPFRNSVWARKRYGAASRKNEWGNCSPLQRGSKVFCTTENQVALVPKYGFSCLKLSLLLSQFPHL